MNRHNIEILDTDKNCIALLDVDTEDGDFGGVIDLSHTPSAILELFNEFDELVNTQVFSLVDDAQEKIITACPWVRFEDGRIEEVTRLDVYPTTGDAVLTVKNPVKAHLNGTSSSIERPVH